jgi:N-acetyl-alpha-D-muramate 1-phosphate uridylyltransferase
MLCLAGMTNSSSKQALSSTAMVLAAGLGQRMRPLTLELPKPLLQVGDRTMLDAALDRLAAAGIRRAVVNTHYLAEKIEAHLKTRRGIETIISHEAELLDTGGGIKNALAHFGGKPFFALNADLPWTEGKTPALARMAAAWDPTKMDALLLLMPTEKARGFGARGERGQRAQSETGIRGDFIMNADGKLHRLDAHPPYPYVMLSAQILKPELFETMQENIFSNNLIWDRAENAGRLYGLVHDGACYHVGTPSDLAEANRLLASGQGWG